SSILALEHVADLQASVDGRSVTWIDGKVAQVRLDLLVGVADLGYPGLGPHRVDQPPALAHVRADEQIDRLTAGVELSAAVQLQAVHLAWPALAVARLSPGSAAVGCEPDAVTPRSGEHFVAGSGHLHQISDLPGLQSLFLDLP